MVAFFEALQSEGFAIGEPSRIKRLHSDRAGEFTAPFFARFLANHRTIITPSLRVMILKQMGQLSEQLVSSNLWLHDA